ncbi:MAG: hypothetical protein PQJ58_00740 [Spirochaetales bacterium]|nr:hypothetical protein [Spirochaetales bacterium]
MSTTAPSRRIICHSQALCGPISGSVLMAASLFLLSCTYSPSEEAWTAYGSAVKSYMSGNTGAVHLFEELCRDYPRFTEASAFYGRVLFYEGEYSQAASILESIPEKTRDLYSTRLLIRSRLRCSETEKAEQILDRLILSDREDPELLYLKARCRLSAKSPEEALTLLRTACTLMEKQIEIPLELASLYSSYGLYSDAEALLSRFIHILDYDHPLRPAVEELTAETGQKKDPPPEKQVSAEDSAGSL